ncbi:hypothetical protein [Janthinobacterium aquaticum]|uniref:hypothetical protein n=1 Tax=Janthinobacterium sp. FT58W TaxID=2654254 RepID=UPI001264639A|nr:hypothetical protein [Janthinobacterium sp. FT58W]KAB8037391.1 hypothetical protein GCM43_23575 [Janthinobacterium sp. FT58W]
MELKKFKGPKSIELIRAQCLLQQLVCDSTLFDQEKSDYIIVFSPKAPEAKVFYTDVNGRFFGRNDRGYEFTSEFPLDGTDWFDALLAFFNEPLPAGYVTVATESQAGLPAVVVNATPVGAELVEA